MICMLVLMKLGIICILETRVDDEFSLAGVSYIKLVGENLLGGKNVHGLEILY